jgi:hypothetical protein
VEVMWHMYLSKLEPETMLIFWKHFSIMELTLTSQIDIDGLL